MTAKTMAEVLADHRDIAWDHVGGTAVCGDCDEVLGTLTAEMDEQDRWLRAHQAAALSAAGFGLVADAGAKAWDECVNEADRQWQIGHASAAILKADNPYRAAVRGEDAHD